ncbi:hypothetical protein Tco_1051723, partial [Tanacetum coccineum]
ENADFAELICEDFRFQIDSRKSRVKDPVFGMPIPMVMLNDDIKASGDYMEHLTKAKGGKPAKGHSKGLFGQSEGVEDDANSEETEDEDEIPLVHRQTRIVIGGQICRKQEKLAKMTSSFNNVPKVLVKDLVWLHSRRHPSDDDDKAAEENVDDAQDKDEQARIEQPKNVQAKESVPEPQVEQPAVPYPSSSQTLSSAKYGNQFINDNPDVSLIDVLKELVEAEVQSLVDVLILQQKPADQQPLLVDTTMTLISEMTLLVQILRYLN